MRVLRTKPKIRNPKSKKTLTLPLSRRTGRGNRTQTTTISRAPEKSGIRLARRSPSFSNNTPASRLTSRLASPLAIPLREPASAGGEPSQSQEPPNITATDLPNTWQRLLDVLSKKGPGIPSILSHGELKSIGDDNVVIQFSSPTFAAMLDRNGKKDVIRDELSTLLARPVGVAIEVSEEIESAPAAVAPRPTPAPSPKPAFRPTAPVMQSVPVSTGLRLTSELKEELREKNPLIAAVMTELGGEIVRVE